MRNIYLYLLIICVSCSYSLDRKHENNTYRRCKINNNHGKKLFHKKKIYTEKYLKPMKKSSRNRFNKKKHKKQKNAYSNDSRIQYNEAWWRLLPISVFTAVSIAACVRLTGDQPPTRKNGNNNSIIDQKYINSKNMVQKKITINSDLKLDDPMQEKALGLCVGSAIGDSIGSYCEFTNKETSTKSASKAMKMPGGGSAWGLIKSGQVTDDTELALCMAYALIDAHKNKDQVYIDRAFKYYKNWKDSNPFDIGDTTREVFSSKDYMKSQNTALEHNNKQCEIHENIGNMANGSLMRISPLIVYSLKVKSMEDLLYIVTLDSIISHWNPAVFVINTIYVAICRYLILHPEEDNRNIKAFDFAYNWIEEKLKNSDSLYKLDPLNYLNILTEEGKEKYKDASNKCMASVFENIKQIFDDIKNSKWKKLYIADECMGMLSIAFQLSLHHLYWGSKYGDAIKHTISRGGDTDTNACIVGGMIGAYRGINADKGIPQDYISKLKNCIPGYNRENIKINGVNRPIQGKVYLKDNGDLTSKLFNIAKNMETLKLSFKNSLEKNIVQIYIQYVYEKEYKWDEQYNYFRH